MPKSTGAPAANLPQVAASATATAVVPRGTKLMTRPDRRRSLRQLFDQPTACVVISLIEPVLLPVRIRNISRKGIGLLIANRVAPGAFLAIKVQGPRLKTPRILRARVVHATFQPENRTWLIGGTFVEELRKEELAILV